MNNPYASPGDRDDLQRQLRRERCIPFSGWYAVGCGAIAGLALRLVFWGEPADAYSAMLASFICLCSTPMMSMAFVPMR